RQCLSQQGDSIRRLRAIENCVWIEEAPVWAPPSRWDFDHRTGVWSLSVPNRADGNPGVTIESVNHIDIGCRPFVVFSDCYGEQVDFMAVLKSMQNCQSQRIVNIVSHVR